MDMKKLLALTLSAGLATAGAQTLSSTGLNGIELGLTGGYANGLSGEVFVHAPNVAGPFGVKAGVSFARTDRLNDNAAAIDLGDADPITLGELKELFEVTETGSDTVASLDGTYSLGELTPGLEATAYAGARYGMFRGTLSYEGESTTYSSNNFGVGAGVMFGYALTGNLSVIADLGVDQFFNSNVSVSQSSGEPTTYEPTSNFYRQPGTVFKARIGVKTSF